MKALNYPFMGCSIAGMWLPDTVNSKTAKVLYKIYQLSIGLFNIVQLICEFMIVIITIYSNGPAQEYNESLFLSISGLTSMAKFSISGIIMNQQIFTLRNTLYQRDFQASNDSEKKLEDNYEKAIKLGIQR